MALTGIYGSLSRDEAIALVRHALEMGVVHFDTAELYGPYVNEELLAEALGPRRHDVVIATKFGYRIEQGKIVGRDSTPSNIRRAVDGSLRRLRRDWIDILYQHRQDPAVPVEDVVGVMSDLVLEGKVRALGLCAVNGELLDRARKIASIAYVQNEYSLIRRPTELASPQGLDRATTMFVCYSPLCRGILSGKTYQTADPTDYRQSDARFAADRHLAVQDELGPLWEIASHNATSPAAVALAWLLALGPSVHVIPGPKTIEQLKACLSAVELSLSDSDLSQLSNLPISH
ncbi:aldo/keto reductase [Bradyrhizobium ganzhouense]|uniref:aldo/keto reductase n=1 Tax=Bradyrhizobium ganzhouense TaxID=1179767 RepID=UPI003CE915CD